MKRNTSIKLKAAFLLTVFALNTVVGFACAIGIDMGFNSQHHHDDDEATEVSVHLHADGKKHEHHNEPNKHHHDEKNSSKKDDCCNDKVTKFEQLDKSVAHSLNIIHPIFFTSFLSAFYNVHLLHPSDVIIDNKHFVRSYHPPIPDIRIAIQSFQI